MNSQIRPSYANVCQTGRASGSRADGLYGKGIQFPDPGRIRPHPGEDFTGRIIGAPMGPAAGGEDGQGKGWKEGEESLFHSDAQWKKIKVSMLCKDTLFSAHSLLSPPVCRARLQDLKKRLIFADMIRILLSWALLLAAAIPTPRAHPRLLLPAGEEETVRARIAEEPEVALADSLILAACEKMMAQPPVVREKIGKRLLHVSREALKRIFYLSYAWRIHAGEDAAGRARRDAYADRAIREMMAVCRFSDWNPTHFLDVGEMTMAVAIGYDWLYPVMTEDQRDSVAAAVRKLAFDASRNEKDAWFYNNTNNWNQVCNAGLSCGAIALFEQFPDEARAILAKCLETNPKALDDYSPEGGYPEGYAYWAYGSAYQILLLASLESAFGTDFGLLEQHGAGFLRSGEFLRMLSTPTGLTYSFYDSDRPAEFQYMQAYLGRVSGDPTLLKTEIDLFRRSHGKMILSEDRMFPFFPIAMARFPVALKDIPDPAVHTYVCGGTTPMLIYRSGWKSPNDTYLAVKGGLSMSSHGHCDQGSFYFEDDGVVWATDIGMQDYESLESKDLHIWSMRQGKDRWKVFRIGPFSHNILTVNGHCPKVFHPAALDETWTGANRSHGPGAGLNLTAIYSEDLDSCYRRVFLEGKDLVIEDYITARDTACTVRWALSSETDARIDHGRILLSKDGKTRTVTPEALRPLQKKPGRYARPPRRSPVPLTACTWPASLPENAPLPPVTGRHEPPFWEWPSPPLHSYDAPNPGIALSGFLLELKPRETVLLRIRIGE